MDNNFYEYTETTWDVEKNMPVPVCKWTFAASGNSHLIIERETPDGQWKKKVFKVRDADEYTYQLLKTRINARDGAKGLYDFMKRSFDENFATVFPLRVLNYCFFQMKEAKV